MFSEGTRLFHSFTDKMFELVSLEDFTAATFAVCMTVRRLGDLRDVLTSGGFMCSVLLLIARPGPLSPSQ